MSRSPESETVTPGKMALLLSLTAPTMEPVCTCAVAEEAASTASAHNTNERIVLMPCPRCGGVRVVTAATIRGNSIEVKTVYLSADAQAGAGGRPLRIFGFVCLGGNTCATAVGCR